VAVDRAADSAVRAAARPAAVAVSPAPEEERGPVVDSPVVQAVVVLPAPAAASRSEEGVPAVPVVVVKAAHVGVPAGAGATSRSSKHRS
jgi:hypothetical protein